MLHHVHWLSPLVVGPDSLLLWYWHPNHLSELSLWRLIVPNDLLRVGLT